jgi:hypothetical protein
VSGAGPPACPYNRKVTASRLALALLLAAPARADTPAPSPPVVSREEALSFERKLDRIKTQSQAKGAGRPESVLVTEGELNSYLNLTYASRMPRGVSDVNVRLQADRIRASGLLDLERVRGNVPAPSAWSPLAYLRGKVSVELAGRLQTRDGFGTFAVDEASIASVPVPMLLLEQIVSSATKKPSDPDGINLNERFRLPYAVSRVRIGMARAVLDF